MLLFDGITSLLSFLVFTLVYHEPLKAHMTEGGDIYYLAPVYLCTTLLGMAALVLLPGWVARRPKQSHTTGSEPLLRPDEQETPPPALSTSLMGCCLALAAGTFSALQFGIVTAGKKEDE